MTVIELTKKLISYNTQKGNTQEVHELFEYLESLFDTEKIDCQYIEHEGILSQIITPKGLDWKTAKLILNGHVDVVAAEEDQFTPREEEGKLFGRGSIDMKSAVACMVLALKESLDAGETPSVAILLTSDEEIGGKNGAGYICQTYDFSPEFVLVPDGPRVGDMEITNREKGIAWVKLTADGKACHASRPWLGDNAADKLLNAMQKIKEHFTVKNEDAWKTTASITNITVDNQTYNKVPKHASAVMDIRFTEEHGLQPEEIVQQVNDITPADVQAELLIGGAPVYIDANNPYVQKLQTIMSDVAEKNINIGFSHAGHDARYFSAKGIPTALIGMTGGNWHSQDEWVSIPSVHIVYNTIKTLLKTAA